MGTSGGDRGSGPGEAIGRALLDAMRERGLATADVARNLPPARNRAMLYRLLAGKGGNTKLSTLLDACQAAGLGPAEILRDAGLDPRPRRAEDALNGELRRAFARIRALPKPLRRIAVAQIGGLAEATEGLAHEES